MPRWVVRDRWEHPGWWPRRNGSGGLCWRTRRTADSCRPWLLDGTTFRADELDPVVRNFYENTAKWRMEVWTQWSGLFQPGGELISRLFGRRVQQLALPTRPLDVAHGMDSRIVHLIDANGQQRSAGWLRTLVATGEFVYSGCYSIRLLPGSDQASVHVAFPLESGNVQVLLQPKVQSDGSLVLVSPPGGFR